MKIMSKYILACAVVVLITSLDHQAKAQEDLPPGFKNWALGGVNLRVTKKTTIKAYQLYALNTNPYGLQFVQSNLGVDRRVSKKVSLGMGYAHSAFKSTNGFKNYHRIYADFAIRHRIGSNIRSKTGLKAEYHWPQLRKFQYRFIVSNKLSFRNDFLPLNGTPYIKNQVFFYAGGRKNKYWETIEEVDEETGEVSSQRELAAEQAPLGWHRYRVTAGIRFKLTRNLSGSIFYTMQKEFNTPWSGNRALNVQNKSQTRTKLPFNNFSLVGVSFFYTIKAYKKSKSYKQPKEDKRKPIFTD